MGKNHMDGVDGEWARAVAAMSDQAAAEPSRGKLDLETTLRTMHEYIRADTEGHQPVSERLIIGNASGSELSHTFFAGGKGSVALSDCPGIQRKYAIDLLVFQSNVSHRSALNHVVERYIPTAFPLFVDIDLKVVREVRDIEAAHRGYFDIVRREVRRFFPSAPAGTVAAIVCGRPMVVKDGREVYGYHVHFPRLFVDWERALTVREAIVAALVREYGERDLGRGENAWNDVVDPCVYSPKGHGLRAIGSFKLKKCGVNDKAAICRKRHIQHDPSGKPATYWPMLALDDDGHADAALQAVIDRTFPEAGGVRGPARQFAPGELRQAATDSAAVSYVRRVMELVQLTSVRVKCEPTPGFVLYEGAPKRVRLPRREDESPEDHAMREIKRQKVVCHKPVPCRRGRQVAVTKDREALFGLVQAYLRGLRRSDGTAIWPRVVVADIFRSDSKRPATLGVSLLVAVIGEGANFCMNLTSKHSARKRGRDHNSNRIYFLVSSKPPFVQQRCHSANPPGNGRFAAPGEAPICCKDFSSSNADCILASRPSAALVRAIEDQAQPAAPAGPEFMGLAAAATDGPPANPASSALARSIRKRMFG